MRLKCRQMFCWRNCSSAHMLSCLRSSVTVSTKIRSGCSAIRANTWAANLSSGETLPPRGFGAALPYSDQRCSHLTAELALSKDSLIHNPLGIHPFKSGEKCFSVRKWSTSAHGSNVDRDPISSSSYAADFRPVDSSTIRVSKPPLRSMEIIGSRGNVLDGSYHGCFSTTPSRTDCASNFPISSPSRATGFLSESNLYNCGQK